MTIKNLVSLTCFVFVLICWLFSAYSSFITLGTIFAAPVLNLTGFVISILALRSKQEKWLSWILFSLHLLILLGYIFVIVYMNFFWHPRFF
jgi:hypothetical protein